MHSRLLKRCTVVLLGIAMLLQAGVFIPKAFADDLTLSGDSSIKKGNTGSITASGVPDGASVSWSSDSGNVSVSGSGSSASVLRLVQRQ